MKTVEEMSRKELNAHALHLEKEQEEYEQQIIILRKRLERYENCLKDIRRITPYGMYHEIIEEALKE